ncbi:MAG: TIGR02281 family clan AA aspartic protease [Gammaproteobacteria bacterium]
MTQNAQQSPGKSIGQGMLIASFSMGLIALTFYFDGWLDKQSNPNAVPLSSENADGIREVVLQRNRQGHYVAGGSVNGIAATFLLDTGATDVAIPAGIAQQAGLPRGYAGQASTANGVVTVYATTIDTLQLGNILLHDIEASITPSMGGETILLGMSALQRIEFTQRGSTLTLRQFVVDRR